MIPIALLAGFLSTGCADVGATTGPKNFVYFARDRDRITETSFLNSDRLVGAQLTYTWRELEPERDRYDFRDLRGRLAFLERHGKRLFVQLQDVSFSERTPVPDYLVADSAFHGGAARKYEANDQLQVNFDGWVARRWDPAVRARFIKLIEALGSEFDGRIEGLNLAETAIGGIPQSRTGDFSYDSYVEGIKSIMTGAGRAFPKSCPLIYANYMPGEGLPENDRGYLRAVYAHADSIGVGVGGPDLRPHRRAQRNNSYPLIARRHGIVAGVAVQDGNLADTNPATGKRVTVGELYRFATDSLRLDYIFWGTEEPYYSKEIIPYFGVRRGTRK